MLPVDAITPDAAPESAVSERRLAANRANAQLSTGPRTEAGKAKSSLNAVKTGLCGRTLLLADEEEAERYRAHAERLLEHWEPVGPEEHALVQSLTDTQWRWEAIPGLESGVYAHARLRYADLYTEEDPSVRRVLLDAYIEETEAKTLRNLRLHERRLRRQFQDDQAELERVRQLRFEAEEQQRREEEKQKAEEEQQRREKEREQRRRERRQARGEKEDSQGNGFEFSTVTETDLTRLTVHKKNGDGNSPV